MRSRFWLLSTLLFALLLSDAAWRIHENMSIAFPAFHNAAFIVYGALLVLLVFIYRESFHTSFWLFLVGFVFLSGTAVLSDTFWGEGVLRIGEWDASFEQFCETLSTLVLACAFASEAIQDLRKIKWTAQ